MKKKLLYIISAICLTCGPLVSCSDYLDKEPDTELTTEMVKLGKMDFRMTQEGEGKACWDCHRDVPHGGKNSLSATVNAKVPFPDSPVPEWLQKAIGHHSPHGHLHGK